MAVSLSDVSGALRTIIMPYVKDNFPKQTVLLDNIKKDADIEVFNNSFYAPIRTARHGGVTNLANGGSKLVSGGATIGSANTGVKILTGTFDIQKLTIDATSATKQSVTKALSFQATSLASDFARNVNRQLYGDGFGIVSEVAGSTNGTTITIQNPSASDQDTRLINAYGTVNGDINANKYLTPGMIIGFGSAAADGAGTVASVSGSTVTFSGFTSAGSAFTANHPIYILDGDGAGAGTSEITGLRAALSTTTGTNTYAGVARNVIGWTPQTDTAAQSLTLSLMESLYISAKEIGQMEDKYAIFVNKTLYRKYGDILTSMRRQTNPTDNLLGGWPGLDFQMGAGKVGVFIDYDVPDGEVLILNMDTWVMAQVSDMNWAENPESGTLLRRADYLTYQASMVWFMNILCTAPGANARGMQKTY